MYDFGDNWIHDVLLEKILPYDESDSYPQVVIGKRAAPWEDSGGSYGYQDKIDILKNKKRKEHQEILDWLGINDISEWVMNK